jgi:hypothetical protein
LSGGFGAIQDKPRQPTNILSKQEGSQMNQPASEYERSYTVEPVKNSSEAIISLIAGILAWLKITS